MPEIRSLVRLAAADPAAHLKDAQAGALTLAAKEDPNGDRVGARSSSSPSSPSPGAAATSRQGRLCARAAASRRAHGRAARGQGRHDRSEARRRRHVRRGTGGRRPRGGRERRGEHRRGSRPLPGGPRRADAGARERRELPAAARSAGDEEADEDEDDDASGVAGRRTGRTNATGTRTTTDERRRPRRRGTASSARSAAAGWRASTSHTTRSSTGPSRSRCWLTISSATRRCAHDSSARADSPHGSRIRTSSPSSTRARRTGSRSSSWSTSRARRWPTCLRREGALPCERAVALAPQARDGLEHAHAAGLVHRDVKPGNLLLSRDGRLKIGDFGIARAVELSGLTQDGTILGTAAYLAPEQARGERVGPAADVYGLGAVLYELLTGRARTRGRVAGRPGRRPPHTDRAGARPGAVGTRADRRGRDERRWPRRPRRARLQPGSAPHWPGPRRRRRRSRRRRSWNRGHRIAFASAPRGSSWRSRASPSSRSRGSRSEGTRIRRRRSSRARLRPSRRDRSLARPPRRRRGTCPSGYARTRAVRPARGWGQRRRRRPASPSRRR